MHKERYRVMRIKHIKSSNSPETTKYGLDIEKNKIDVLIDGIKKYRFIIPFVLTDLDIYVPRINVGLMSSSYYEHETDPKIKKEFGLDTDDIIDYTIFVDFDRKDLPYKVEIKLRTTVPILYMMNESKQFMAIHPLDEHNTFITRILEE
jgi:hypothetical protein